MEQAISIHCVYYRVYVKHNYAFYRTNIIKGWIMDDERLKRGTYLTEKNFDEQLERIREICASECFIKKSRIFKRSQ